MSAPSPSEWKLLNILWRRKKATARAVWEDIKSETAWAYATVKTMLDRLEVKGLVTSERVGPVKVYLPAQRQRDLVPRAVADFVDVVLDGSMAPLVSYISRTRGLSKREIADLEKLLDGEEP